MASTAAYANSTAPNLLLLFGPPAGECRFKQDVTPEVILTCTWLSSSKSQRPTTHCRLPAATLAVLWTWEDQAVAPSQRSLYQRVKKFRKSEHIGSFSQMEQLLWLSVVWAGAGLSGHY